VNPDNTARAHCLSPRMPKLRVLSLQSKPSKSLLLGGVLSLLQMFRI